MAKFKKTQRGVRFFDSTKYVSKNLHGNPMRGCWVNGDPREVGLIRYDLVLTDGKREKPINSSVLWAQYTVLFDDLKAVSIERMAGR